MSENTRTWRSSNLEEIYRFIDEESRDMEMLEGNPNSVHDFIQKRLQILKERVLEMDSDTK